MRESLQRNSGFWPIRAKMNLIQNRVLAASALALSVAWLRGCAAVQGGGRRSLTKRPTLLGFSLLLAACNGLTTTEVQPTEVQPTITRMEFTKTSYQAARKPVIELIVVLGVDERLDEGEFITMLVRTTSGTTIEARVTPQLCSSDVGGRFWCNQLVVTLQPGRTAIDLDPLLHDLDGKFAESGRLGGDVFGVIHIFSGSVDEAVQGAGQYDVVRLADYNHLVVSAGANDDEPSPHAFIPTDKTLGPRERALTVSAGDKVLATYTNPDGSIITASTEIF